MQKKDFFLIVIIFFCLFQKRRIDDSDDDLDFDPESVSVVPRATTGRSRPAAKYTFDSDEEEDFQIKKCAQNKKRKTIYLLKKLIGIVDEINIYINYFHQHLTDDDHDF